MTITFDDAREFLRLHNYELAHVGGKAQYEVRVYRGFPHGLFRRNYQSTDSAIRNLGLAQQYEEWRLARWQQEATR